MKNLSGNMLFVSSIGVPKLILIPGFFSGGRYFLQASNHHQ